MADRENGGTSMCEVISSAATRPPASSSRTRSVRVIGRTAASRRRRASSSEIVATKGRTRAGALSLSMTARRPETNDALRPSASPRCLLHQVAEFRNQQTLHGQADRGLRSGQRDDDVSGGDAGTGAAHHRGGTDLFVAEHPEQLPESVEALLKQRRNGFICTVARGDSRSSGGDDDLHVGARHL